ncbi:MAG: glycoside hydrolase family 43 protein [Marinoscillum sp.]
MITKKLLWAIILLHLFSCTSVEKSGNPIINGWYADPESVVFGNEYWIYPTFSDIYSNQVHLDAFSSKDLITWTKHERIIDTAAVSWADSAMWAPAIIKKQDQYFLFFAANDIQNNESVGGIGVAVSDSPAGPFSDHLGKPLLDSIVNGAQPIDQFVFQDTDGQYYMIYGGWRHCNIVRLSSDFKRILPYEYGSMFKEITPDQYVEGPIMFIRNEKYYFMWSEGGWGGPDYRVAYAIADSPFGPFERIGTVLQQDPKVATGAGHHSLLKNGDMWYIVYHRRPLNDMERDHRVVCIDRMEFDDEGRIKPVIITFEGVEKNDL